MKILVVGSGGREHALAWKIAESPLVREVVTAPGNPGTARVGRNVAVRADDLAGIVALATRERVDLVVVGPEAPLVAGLVDALADAGVLAFGPRASAARLEGSKAFSKHFMKRHAIPTAAFEAFTDPDAAEAYVRRAGRPLVVKADGLAAGKGVVVASSPDEASAAVRSIMRERAFGDAGGEVVIEERLVGEEISYHVVSDGSRYVALAAAQDHKRLRDRDEGPNTGGMGAYGPPPVLTAELEREVLTRVVEPTLAGMAADGAPFRGALFVGLMIVDGRPLVLEYNTRFGDPETEVMMARLGSDVVPLLAGSARGSLVGVDVRWDAPAAMTVVLASEGYPGSSPRGRVIEGLDDAELVHGARVFHAGTASEGGRVVTAGGRVLAVTASGDDVAQAAARAYDAVGRIRFDGMQYRRDIGWRARAASG